MTKKLAVGRLFSFFEIFNYLLVYMVNLFRYIDAHTKNKKKIIKVIPLQSSGVSFCNYLNNSLTSVCLNLWGRGTEVV